MLKIIALSLTFVSIALPASAGKNNPCEPGYDWLPEKQVCIDKLVPKLAQRAPCKVGTTQSINLGNGHTRIQTCGWVK